MSRANVEFLDGLSQFNTLGAGHSADIEIPSSRWRQQGAAAHLTIYYRHASGREYVTQSSVTIEGDIVSVLTFRRVLVPTPGPVRRLIRRAMGR